MVENGTDEMTVIYGMQVRWTPFTLSGSLVKSPIADYSAAQSTLEFAGFSMRVEFPLLSNIQWPRWVLAAVGQIIDVIVIISDLVRARRDIQSCK